MDVVSLLYNKIQILHYRRRFLGKSHFATANVILPPEEAQTFNLDHWAIYLKKAIEQLGVKIDKHRVRLILGQRFWRYERVELPPDIQESAKEQYLKDQLDSKIGADSQSAYLKYIIADFKGKKFAGVYLLTKKTYDDVRTLLSFYDLKSELIYPEAMLVFTLFEHTLNKQKEEAALYMEYEAGLSTGLLFDSIGLLKEQQVILSSDELQKELKQFKKEQDLIIARLILGGKLSTQIRQDNFTKESGIWTNPLDKVLANSSLKQFAERHNIDKELMQFNREIALLSLEQSKLDRNFALPLKAKHPLLFSGVQLSREKTFPSKMLLKTLFLITITSFLTYGVIIFGARGLSQLQRFPILQPRATPILPTAGPKRLKPTPTSVITLDRSQLTLEILNGTGIAGMAGLLETELEDLGYSVDNVGNADNYDYTATVIITQNRKAFNLLARDLAKFNVSSPKYEQTNDSTSTIIFGTDLKLP